MNKHLIILIVLGILIVGGILYIYNPEPDNYTAPETVFCTMDAKMCPDGSYVGRVAPSCEFAPCPIPGDAVMEDGTIDEY